MKVGEILQSKGSQLSRESSELVKITEQASIKEAVGKMVDESVGSLIVIDDKERISGIMTERDLLKGYLNKESKAGKVREVMTRDLIMVAPTDNVSYVMGLMSSNNIRHMPVTTNKELVGLISMRDVVRSLYEKTKSENESLKKYISRTYTG